MISVIIIVKDDIKIEFTLKDLRLIKKPEKTEIIVVDASEGNLDDIKNKFPKVRWIYFHNKTNKKITIPEQRNLGIKKTKGDIIVFVDAGCKIKRDWLVKLTSSIINGKELIVSGRIKSIGKNKIHDDYWKKIKSPYLECCGTANLALKKELFLDIGYFDENFSIGEDVDFTWRALDKGYKILYVPKAIMYHDWGTFRQEIKRSFYYGKAKAKLYKKHFKTKWKNLFGYDIVALVYPAYILMLPLTFLFKFYPLLIFIPLIKNITKKPFETVFLNLIYGLGVLKEFFFSNKNKIYSNGGSEIFK